MIDNKSFDLFNKLVNENHFNKLFDITIIYQVNETLNNIEKDLEDEEFKNLCSEVKHQYLKYNDVDLNDDLVENIMKEMGM